MIIEDVVEFLKNVPPFLFLDDAALKKVASGVSMEFYPKGSMILQQDGPPSEYLRVIKKGGAKVSIRSGEGEDILIDYRGEGDIIGFLSLFSADKSRANVLAVEDTICYLIDRETARGISDANPAIRDFFQKSFLNKYLDRTFQEMRNKSLLYGGGEKLLYTTPIGELATRDVTTASPDITIREAAEVMSKHRISSLVFIEPDGVPVGIVTDRDLRERVVARGRSVTDPVSSIMSITLIKADAKDFCFEALLKMIRYNIHHLLVIDNGKLKGIITNHDLMMIQGTSPISLAREIEVQQTVEGLVPLSKKVNKLVTLLLSEGAKASNIARVISEVHDRLVRKVLEITERKMGLPPVNYCWIVFGSEGRKEQTFRTDQDNAIIYADPKDDAQAEEVKKYFSVFTLSVRDSLLKCGLPLCPADYMASNPQWCQPLAVWKKYFLHWVSVPSPESVLRSLIFFDFRSLHGDCTLAEELREYLLKVVKGQNVFLAQMASAITKSTPPLGFFKTFIVEKGGEHKDALNLKLRGIGPLVDIVRFCALESGIPDVSTLERIEALRERHSVIREMGDELAQAFEFITLLRLHHQVELIESGREPDNFVNPSKLSNLEKKSLKEAFQVISRIQDVIREQYGPGMVNQ